MTFFGRCFVRFFSNFGSEIRSPSLSLGKRVCRLLSLPNPSVPHSYDDLIRSAGRHFCDFLNGVDNIHQQMRFSYPKMKSPSMFLAEADEGGAVLVYRSKRQGFLPYLIGQLQQVAETFYSTSLAVEVLSEDDTDAGADHRVEARLRLDFDNRAYMEARGALRERRQRADLQLPAVNAGLLLELFPFGALLQVGMAVLRNHLAASLG